jgi:hypothetical protein
MSRSDGGVASAGPALAASALRWVGGLSEPSESRSSTNLLVAISALGASVAYYLVYNERLVSSTGLYFDELIQVVPVINGFHADRPSPWSHPPFMTMPYIGEVKQLVMWPTVTFFGHGPVAIRTTTLVLGMITLVLAFVLVRRLLPSSSLSAALAVALLSVDPSFSFFTRIDYGPNAVMFVLKLAALLLLLQWWRDGRWWVLFLAGLTLGIGLYDKANFWWVIASIVGAGVLVDPRGCRSRLRIGTALAFVIGLVVGALPLIWYNLIGLHFPTLRSAGDQTDIAKGVLGRLSERLRMLESVLTGRWIRGTNGASAASNPLWRAAAVLVLVAIVVGLRSQKPEVRAVLRPLCFCVFALLLTVGSAVLTTGGYAQHHLVLTYPFPHLAVAMAFVLLCRSIQHSERVKVLKTMGLLSVLALVSSLALVDLNTNQRLARAFERTGGVGNWSNATALLGPALKRLTPTSPVVAADWGISVPLYVYENGTVPVVDDYPALQASASRGLGLPAGMFHAGVLVVTHPQDRTNFPDARAAFFSRSRLSRLTPELESVIADGTGHTELEIWRLEPTRS